MLELRADMSSYRGPVQSTAEPSRGSVVASSRTVMSVWLAPC